MGLLYIPGMYMHLCNTSLEKEMICTLYIYIYIVGRGGGILVERVCVRYSLGTWLS